MRFKLTIFLLISIDAFAYEYITGQETDLKSVAEELYQKHNREKADYLQDLKKWNPKWIEKKIPSGEILNVTYPYSAHLGFGKLDDKLKIKNSEELKINIGFAASVGTYSQSGPTTKISFKQNSPGTVQVMASKKMSENYYFDGSMYLSKIMDAKVSGTNNSVARIPYDFGATIYLGRKFFNQNWGIYGGYDFERFYLFNMQKLETSNELEVQSSNLHYATLGLGYSTKGYFAKLSASLVASASSQIAADISGLKWIIFAGKKITRDFGVGIFIKGHSLEYDSRTVKATRLGLSVYSLL